MGTSVTIALAVETLEETSTMVTTLVTLEVEETFLVGTKATWVALEAKEIKAVVSTTNSSNSSSSKATLAIRWEEILAATMGIRATPLPAIQEGSTLRLAVETLARSRVMGRIPPMADQVLVARCRQG